MLSREEYYQIYSGIMRTFKKRVAVIIDPKPTIDLIQISGSIFYKGNSQANRKGLTLTQEEAQDCIKSLLKSQTSMRWFKSFRIPTCETDEDIMKVY